MRREPVLSIRSCEAPQPLLAQQVTGGLLLRKPLDEGSAERERELAILDCVQFNASLASERCVTAQADAGCFGVTMAAHAALGGCIDAGPRSISPSRTSHS